MSMNAWQKDFFWQRNTVTLLWVWDMVKIRTVKKYSMLNVNPVYECTHFFSF